MSKAVVGVAVLLAAGVAALAVQRRPVARFEREIPWAGKGTWLKAETHVHSKFSDGNHTIDELADRAAANGCDVLAITDHSDGGLKAGTAEYHAAIAAARARTPQMLVLTGIEWNVPPGKGQDHAVVLFPPELEDAAITGEFKEKFDDENKEGENPELALAAFEWLRRHSTKATAPVVMFLNHPSRRAPDITAVHKQLSWLSKISGGIFVGAEGAPGHQNAKPLGAYGGRLQPEDRWDPAIAPPGAAWDQRLGAGTHLWGALATSDFHGPGGDYWPCQFSATWVYARERSVVGVLEALHAGSFIGVHGDIAREIQLSLTSEGLPRAAIAGETVGLRNGAPVTIELRATVPPTDWEGQPNHLDLVDIFGVASSGTTVLHSGPLVDGLLRYQMSVPPGGITIRARGRRVVEDGPDLLFYTNPIAVR